MPLVAQETIPTLCICFNGVPIPLQPSLTSATAAEPAADNTGPVSAQDRENIGDLDDKVERLVSQHGKMEMD